MIWNDMLLLYVSAPGLEMAHRLSNDANRSKETCLETTHQFVDIKRRHAMTVMNLYHPLTHTVNICEQRLHKPYQETAMTIYDMASDQRVQFNSRGLSHTTAVRPAKLFVLPCEEKTDKTNSEGNFVGHEIPWKRQIRLATLDCFSPAHTCLQLHLSVAVSFVHFDTSHFFTFPRFLSLSSKPVQLMLTQHEGRNFYQRHVTWAVDGWTHSFHIAWLDVAWCDLHGSRSLAESSFASPSPANTSHWLRTGCARRVWVSSLRNTRNAQVLNYSG